MNTYEYIYLGIAVIGFFSSYNYEGSSHYPVKVKIFGSLILGILWLPASIYRIFKILQESMR